jgi:hypothetical protein
MATPVAAAFRDYARDIHQRIELVASAMPPDKYSSRPTPPQRSFFEVLRGVTVRSRDLCARIGGVTQPGFAPVPTVVDKASLVTSFQETTRFCETALQGLTDATLSEVVSVDLGIERVGNLTPKTRAAAITGTIAYWSATYDELASDLRLNGQFPPKPCDGVNNETSCGSGTNLCQNFPTPGLRGLKFELSGAPYSIRGDDRGPYVAAVDNVANVFAGYAAVLVLGPSKQGQVSHRSVSIDLDHPVAGDIGRALGIITDDHDMEVAAQWYSDADQRGHGVTDIPIGTTVKAAQADTEFHINGVVHDLQMGPQPIGHCFSDPTAVFGRGTSQATITRTDDSTWVVDLPEGSIGRLFDVHLSYPNAVNKGLYHVSLHYVLRR